MFATTASFLFSSWTLNSFVPRLFLSQRATTGGNGRAAKIALAQQSFDIDDKVKENLYFCWL